MNLHQAKLDICEAGRRIFLQGYVASNDGNISCRIDDDRILTTPTGVSKGFMKPEDLCIVDMNGKKISGLNRPSSEIGMHIFLYRERPDMRAVVHAHPPTATGFAVAGIPLSECVLPEVVITLGSIPIAEYGTPGGPEISEPIRKWVKDRGLRYTPANDREAARYFARRPGTLARQLASRIEQSPEPLHIVDGVRSVHDMKVLRDQFDVRVVALSLPRAERYRRLLLRQRFADTDEHYLRDRDRREIGLGVLHVLRHPFRRVDNSGRVEALEGIASRLGRELDASWRGAR